MKLALLISGSLLLALSMGACGGTGSDDSVNSADYFASLTSLLEDHQRKLLRQVRDVGLVDLNELQPNDWERVRAGLEAQYTLGDELLSDLRKIHTPSLVERAHKEFLRSAETYFEFSREVSMRTSLDQARAFLTPTTEASSIAALFRLVAACFDLQALAYADDLSIDLNCVDSFSPTQSVTRQAPRTTT